MARLTLSAPMSSQRVVLDVVSSSDEDDRRPARGGGVLIDLDASSVDASDGPPPLMVPRDMREPSSSSSSEEQDNDDSDSDYEEPSLPSDDDDSPHEKKETDDAEGFLHVRDYEDPVGGSNQTLVDPRALPFFLRTRFANSSSRAAMFAKLTSAMPFLFPRALLAPSVIEGAVLGIWDIARSVWDTATAVNFDAFFSDELTQHKDKDADGITEYIGPRDGVTSIWMQGLTLGSLRSDMAPSASGAARRRLTRSAFFGRLLNALTTAYPFIVTPHFATFLGLTVVNVEDGTPPFEMATLWDTGSTPKEGPEKGMSWTLTEAMDAFFKADDDLPVRAIIFQVLFSLSAAARTLGVHYRLNDLNDISLAVDRDENHVETYVQRVWSYKFAGNDEWVNMVPRVHHNMFATLNHRFSTVTLLPTEPGGDDGRTAFFANVEHLVSLLIPLLSYFGMYALLGDIGDWKEQIRNYTGDARKEMIHRFYDDWFWDKKRGGLGNLFKSFDVEYTNVFKPRSDDDDDSPWYANKMFYLMGVMPSDNLAVTEHEAAAPLSVLWGLKQGYKRTDFGCHTCGAAPRFSTLDDQHHFCSESCADVLCANVKHY